MNQPLIITCAISGAEVTKAHNPAVPYTVQEMAIAAQEAVHAGASVIHLHARYDDGTPTQKADRYLEIIQAIQAKCPDVIIQVSTGGAVGMSRVERLEVLQVKPEMATLDCGTLNFGGDEIFVNTENDIIYFANTMQEQWIHYECECFEKGHIDMVKRLVRLGKITQPLRFSFVLGVNGGMTGEDRDFHFLRESIPSNSTYSVAGIGKYEFPLAKLAIEHGGHVRVGLEDNLYISKGVLAKNNAELVSKVVQMAKEFGRDIATPHQARQILRMEKN